jgi:hypothetical protein
VFGGQQNDEVLIVLFWRLAENFVVNFGYGCMNSIHCNVDLGVLAQHLL